MPPHLWNDSSWSVLEQLCQNFNDVLQILEKQLPNLNTEDIALSVLRYSAEHIAQQLRIKEARAAAFKEAFQRVFDSVLFSTNCYDYTANNRRINAGAKGIPGNSGRTHTRQNPPRIENPLDEESIESLHADLLLDGFLPFDPLNGAPEDGYLCYVFASREDYHFVREDQNGHSHKNGHKYVSDKDINSQTIRAPLRSNFGKYSSLIGVLECPRGGVRTLPCFSFTQ